MRLEAGNNSCRWAKGPRAGLTLGRNGIGGSKSFRSRSSSPYWQPTGASCPRGHAVGRVPARHPEAKYRKVCLQLNNQQAAPFPEDVLVGEYFPDRHREIQKVVWALL